MALAQQLAELALANSQGLLKYLHLSRRHSCGLISTSSDDEYRLLRQNLFEQHSTTALVPVEAPILPVARPGRTSSSRRVRIADTPIIQESPASRKSYAHGKNSFTASVTSLLKRGSGDKASASPDIQSTSPNKAGLIPRLHKKASQLFSGRDRRLSSTNAGSSMIQPSYMDSSRTQHPLTAPLRYSQRATIPTFPSAQLVTSSSSEIFDDRNLSTVKDIRAAIIATEAEAERLLEAFNDVESLASFRVTQKNARRLRATTPDHVTAVMDGSNWRKSTPAKFSQPKQQVYYPVPMGEKVTDDSSIRSVSPSTKTGLLRSKSFSSLRSKLNPASALSARVSASASSPPPSILHKKNSMSSIASQAKFGIASDLNLSRSNGHFSLYKLSEAEDVMDADFPEAVDMDDNPEVFEIQRRRDEVIARYDARLEYLRARLKSAELRERLMRR
ncbi:hypothetical protein C0992_008094 [Termitomyces sp. T32_za158]|nr:hypothetical protein C0992_008094 [Termitomyces sp. T32_za158]